jgi:hypothetical protein
MKRFPLLVPAFVLVLAGCTVQADQDSKTAKKEETYRVQVRGHLDKLEAQLKDLKVRAQKAGAETRAKLQPQIDALEKQTTALRRRLEELKDKGAAAWEAARPELDKAVKNLRDAFQKAADRFKK